MFTRNVSQIDQRRRRHLIPAPPLRGHTVQGAQALLHVPGHDGHGRATKGFPRTIVIPTRKLLPSRIDVFEGQLTAKSRPPRKKHTTRIDSTHGIEMLRTQQSAVIVRFVCPRKTTLPRHRHQTRHHQPIAIVEVNFLLQYGHAHLIKRQRRRQQIVPRMGLRMTGCHTVQRSEPRVPGGLFVHDEMHWSGTSYLRLPHVLQGLQKSQHQRGLVLRGGRRITDHRDGNRRKWLAMLMGDTQRRTLPECSLEVVVLDIEVDDHRVRIALSVDFGQCGGHMVECAPDGHPTLGQSKCSLRPHNPRVKPRRHLLVAVQRLHLIGWSDRRGARLERGG